MDDNESVMFLTEENVREYSIFGSFDASNFQILNLNCIFEEVSSMKYFTITIERINEINDKNNVEITIKFYLGLLVFIKFNSIN